MFQRRSIIMMFSWVIVPCAFAWADDKPRSMEKNWPAWRGPLATGEAPKADPPIEWGEKTNLRWKVEIPGRAHASPIVWGDRVYIQTAVETNKEDARAAADSERDDSYLWYYQPGTGGPPGGEGRRRGPGGSGPGGRRGGFGPGPKPSHAFDFQVLAIDRKTGKTAWTTTVREEKPHEGGHPTASQASNSPVTDGQDLYAYFGSRGLYCLTLDGKVKWDVDLGDMRTRNEFGEGSSPVLYGDTIVVNWDHEGDDFIVALDKNTGKERWRTTRDEPTSWSTPVVVKANGMPQVIVTATNHVISYDLATGKEIWRCSGMTPNVIPSSMAGGGLFYAISGFKGAALLAIDYAKAKGDITGKPAIAWKFDRETPYVPSAVLYEDRLYFLDNNRPLLTCLDAKSGKPLYEKQRLPGIENVYSSLVAAAGHVYIIGREGKAVVVKAGPKFEIAAKNELDDEFNASPAIAGSELFLRGAKNLYCIAKKK